MYSLLRQVGWRRVAFVEAPALVGSLFVAEAFYRFGSFTLECAAFLVTWACASFLLSTIFTVGRRLLGRGPEGGDDAREQAIS